MRKMKDSGVAWIGEIPEEWAIKKLKYLTYCNENTLQENTNKETKINYIDISSVSENGITEIQNINFGNAPSRARRIVHNGDIIVSTVRTYLRAVAYIEEIYDNYICSTGFAVLTSREKEILSKFLYYSIFSDFFVSTVEKLSVGISYPAITAENLQEIKILVPPLPEQHRIADYLDAKCAEIDHSMELVRQGIDKLKEYKKSVITEAVTKGLAPEVPMRDSGVLWIGEIPIKWRIVPLKKQLINIVDYRGKTPEKVSSGVFLVTAKNIKNGKIDYSLSQEYVSKKEYNTIMSRGLPQKGDLLFTTEAPLGEVAIVDREDIALAQRIIKFTVNNSILNNLFLKYWITSSGFQFFLHTLSTGSTAEGIKASKIFMLPLVLPPLPEQEHIASYLDAKCAEIDTLIAQKQALLDKLAEYKKSLIFECVTGKREVAA